jgi:hypothetical protein
MTRMSLKVTRLSVLLQLLAQIIHPAKATFTYNSTGCASSSDFDTCWTTANNDLTTCWANHCEGSTGQTCTDFTGCISTSSMCTNACFCVLYANLINCALTNCWNQVSTPPPHQGPNLIQIDLLLQLSTTCNPRTSKLSDSTSSNPLLPSTGKRARKLFLLDWKFIRCWKTSVN